MKKTKKFLSQKVLGECECGSPDHILVARVEEWDKNDVDFYLFTQATPLYGFWKRVAFAVKYIFGRRPKYGTWQETILKRSDAVKLRDLLTKYLRRTA